MNVLKCHSIAHLKRLRWCIVSYVYFTAVKKKGIRILTNSTGVCEDQIRSFIHSFNPQIFVEFCCVPGTVLGMVDVSVNKTDDNLYSCGVYSSVRRRHVNNTYK